MNTFLPTKQHYALPTLVIFLVVLFGGFFYVKPLWDEVNNLSFDKDQKQLQVNTLTKQFQDFQDLQKNLGDTTEVGKETNLNAIPERFEQDKLILDITGIAQRNQVILNGINFGFSPDSSGKIKRATVNVNLTGSEENLITFLKGVEANQRKLVVKSITVQSGKTEGGVARVNFNVNMETYYQNRI